MFHSSIRNPLRSSAARRKSIAKPNSKPDSKPRPASNAAAPWFESRHLKQVSNEAASSNGRMLGGLLNYNVNGDLPNLFASALRSGLSEGDGAQPVREFADFLRQLGAKKPDRVSGFEGEVLSKLTGADRDRIKRLADGPPPRPVNAYAYRRDNDDLRDSLRTMEHRNDMVWENGKWRARTPTDRAPGDLRLLSEDGGGDAGGNNRDENANADRQPQLAAAGEPDGRSGVHRTSARQSASNRADSKNSALQDHGQERRRQMGNSRPCP